MMKDAVFAGKVFVLGEQDRYRYFMWGDVQLPHDWDSEDWTMITSVAEPADGAFLCKLDTGWIFVVGASESSNFRHTFFDDSPQADDNAKNMHALGVPVLDLEEAKKQVQEARVPLRSITAEERQRAEALAKSASLKKGKR